MNLPDSVLEQIRAVASTIHHGSITIHLCAERDSIDIEVNSRERLTLKGSQP